MTSLLTRYSFPSPLEKFLIGLDRFENDLSDLSWAETKYPPYNLVKDDAEHYTIEMAVAGFKPEDISVKSKNGLLTISAKTEKTTDSKEKDYVYRGLASREFSQSFRLYEHTNVTGVGFDNGILKVKLEYKLPDHLKEQTYTIEDHSTKQLT